MQTAQDTISSRPVRPLQRPPPYSVCGDTIKSHSYKDAGVDIAAGAALVERIRPLAAATARAGSDSLIGGFAGAFDLKAAGYTDPVLLAATDGVGTKLRIAIAAGHHDTVGIDLVAMCVNDLAVHGAEPLFFLDYFATARLDVDVAASVVAGIAVGCRQAGCALIGGETAEMPGMYHGEDYDLAGFAVGAVERGSALNGEHVAAGDVVLGLASSGLHANGFSLVRRICEASEQEWGAPAPFDKTQPLGRALLVPTRIYVKSCLAAVAAGGVKAFAHITGGGFEENVARVLPDNTACTIDASRWTPAPVFHWLADAGGVAADEMMRTFNCGIGMVAVVEAAKAEAVAALLEQHGETVSVIGETTAADGDRQVHIANARF